MKKALTLRRIIPLLLLAMLVGWVVSGLFAPQIKRVDTSTGIEILDARLVEQVKIVDGDQRVQLTLVDNWATALPEDAPEDWADYPEQIEFFWTEAQGEEIVDTVKGANPEGGYDSEVPQANIWSTLAFTFLP
ncbi:MAG: hypothetical protein ACK4MD_08900, partial [Demequina sp.]